MEDSPAHSLRVLFPGIAEGFPSAPTNMRLHERRSGCFMLAGLPWRSVGAPSHKCSARRCSFKTLPLL